MFLNYYTIVAAIVTGSVAGTVAVSLIRRSVGSVQIVTSVAAVGVGGTFLFNIGALFIARADIFTSIHVIYLMLTVGVPLVGLIVLVFARIRTPLITALCVLALVPIPFGLYATHIEPFWLRTDHIELESRWISGNSDRRARRSANPRSVSYEESCIGPGSSRTRPG